jgi:hypothetical protein
MQCSQLARHKSAGYTSNRKDCPAHIHPICPLEISLLFNNEASHLAPCSDILVDGELFSGSYYISLKDRGQGLVGELNSCKLAALAWWARDSLVSGHTSPPTCMYIHVHMCVCMYVCIHI